ncbi:deoxynucleoside kinase [Deinococcus peraridilitoris]|uniref:Deoxynucleoside kinase n=1 Tax=Deinococcus peraridilitoris (strain DSM 19664 / LMG 22246 / CIP 109416 / KR-200) TaxID=937777 RepID=L0A412_DEIPD|nr:deoxynucleoside kinase [Deinococcus peraridilitoris]AFZ68159.1 deoxynucleoside kinase [Deinococcus peraridilitoris DSM 19664]
MYLVVEGPIGVGKTSLTRLLAREFGARVNLEIVEENPFLAAFYENPSAFAFQVQVFFLLSRFKQLQALSQAELFAGNVVSDYLFDKDFIFAAMNLRDHEFSLYEDLYRHLKPRLARPDLVVYLRAESDLLLARIAQRGRPFEQAMESAYLADLTKRYDEYFRTYDGKVLFVDASEYDYVGNPSDETAILRRVRDALHDELVVS